MELERQTSRRRFLRQLATGLAVGIGAAALPGRTRASTQDNGQCCISGIHCNQSCPTGQANYWCDCLSYSYCTGCISNSPGQCYLAPC